MKLLSEKLNMNSGTNSLPGWGGLGWGDFNRKSIQPSLEFVSSPQLANKFFSLPRRDMCHDGCKNATNHSTFQPFNHSTRKAAFTLAEVLITLGVIGVVAAITMPTLIKNYQKMVWVNQLKKSVSVVENGFRLYLADEDVSKLSDTQELGNNIDEYTGIFNPKIFDLLKKYMNIISINSNGIDYNKCTSLNGSACDYDIVSPGAEAYLSDGSSLIFVVESNNSAISSEYNVVSIGVAIDVNGDKKPNKVGRDIFSFGVDDTGKIVNYGTREDCKSKYAFGRTCLYYLRENGWKMDY